jgi:hypothetical protein
MKRSATLAAGMLVAAVAAGGCRFSINALPIGGPDLAVPDGAIVADLSRPIPDGATPGGLGYPCDKGNQCQSGSCVDGYCCESPCDRADPANLCKACNVPGSEGHCVDAPAGTDPHAQCDADPVASCAQDGLCDGSGHCRLYAAATVCATASCTNGVLTPAATCDGAGDCVGGSTVDCAPYACASATACATTCTPPANGCQAPATCSGGKCGGALANGAPCGSPGQCASGHCAQGVCCDMACTGACQACNQSGSVGTCSPVPAGTQCASPTCSGDSTVTARACDNNGNCLPGTLRSCVPYTCNTATGMCYSRPCMSDSQCSSGHTCSPSGRCQ